MRGWAGGCSGAVCPPPFADSEGDDALQPDFDEDVTGEIDTTDNGELDDFSEDADNIDKCIRKSKDEGILPKRQYMKALTQDQYDKIIGKDAYGFLHGHEDEIIEVLMVGKEVSDDFKTITPIDVREVYRIIITELEKMGWSSDVMVEQIMTAFPLLKEYEAQRIVRTELTRIINYSKEFIAERNDLGEYNYGWVGPLDYRTTPMCYYMQTGELRESDRKLLAKLGRTEADLPPIPEEGMPLEQLKETCHKVAEVFGYDMISDWVMHINCRHTFARGNRRLDLEIADEDEIDRLVGHFANLPGGWGSQPTYVDIETETEEDRMYFQVFDGYDSYIFINSIYRVPTMYDNPDTDEIFVFETMNEKDVASWARLVVQLREENLDDTTIAWALQDTGNLEDDVLGYIMAHADEIERRAENEGWFS